MKNYDRQELRNIASRLGINDLELDDLLDVVRARAELEHSQDKAKLKPEVAGLAVQINGLRIMRLERQKRLNELRNNKGFINRVIRFFARKKLDWLDSKIFKKERKYKKRNERLNCINQEISNEQICRQALVKTDYSIGKRLSNAVNKNNGSTKGEVYDVL